MTTSGFAAITARRNASASNASATTPRAPSASIAAIFSGRPRGAGDGVAGGMQELEQRLPDHAGRAGDEDIHDRRTPSLSLHRGVTCAVS